jgi:metallo-beta-lactamase family protein
MKIRFFGATGGTTGSCHMLSVGGTNVLLECGQFQGPRRESYLRNASFKFAAREIDAVVLSHAHVDHSGKLPMLVRQGYRGAIHATDATRDLCEPMLLDAAHIQLKDAEHMNQQRLCKKLRDTRFQPARPPRGTRKQRARRDEKSFDSGPPALGPSNPPRSEIAPLYLDEDVRETLPLFQPHAYGAWFTVNSSLRARFHDSGHILGSAWVELEAREAGGTKRIAFTGDYGRVQPILRDPEPLLPADIVISESTYGDRCHPPADDTEQQLEGAVKRLLARGRGKLLIPAFAVGRTQYVLYALEGILTRNRAQSLRVVVDSPLASKATQIVADHPECFDAQALERLERVRRGESKRMALQFTETIDDSKRLNRDPGPVIIVSASGMMESGRILHHLAWGISNPDTEIAVVGFQAAHTLGRRIVDGEREVNIMGFRHAVRARVTVMNGFSAHADRDGLLEVLTPLAPSTGALFLVHGEDDQRIPLARNLRERGFARVELPQNASAWEL